MSQSELRKRIITVMGKPEGDRIIVNMILNDLDMRMLAYWSVLGDMGMSSTEFQKIKKVVKKRL